MKRFCGILILGIIFLMAGSSIAQVQLGLLGVGGKLGYVKPEDIDGTVTFGGIVNLGTLAPNVGLEANVDYWSKSQGGPNAEASFRDLSLVGAVKYFFNMQNSQIKPYALGGLGFHFLKSKLTVPEFFPGFGGTVAEETKTKIGVDVGGGVMYGMNEKMDLLGEVRYRIVSDVSQFVITAGAMYHLK